MSCAHACCIADAHFDDRFADKQLERYRHRGVRGATRRLLTAISAAGVRGATVLDVGGGIGALASELLAAGATQATVVDASRASLDAARVQALRRGVGTRTQLVHGDFVALAPGIEAADVVTLDKVVCCSPDMAGLIDRSSERARRLYGIVYPRDAWWNRLVIAAQNMLRRVRGTSFRMYVHPVAEIERRIARGGLVLRSRQRDLLWVTDLYER